MGASLDTPDHIFRVTAIDMSRSVKRSHNPPLSCATSFLSLVAFLSLLIAIHVEPRAPREITSFVPADRTLSTNGDRQSEIHGGRDPDLQDAGRDDAGDSRRSFRHHNHVAVIRKLGVDLDLEVRGPGVGLDLNLVVDDEVLSRVVVAVATPVEDDVRRPLRQVALVVAEPPTHVEAAVLLRDFLSRRLVVLLGTTLAPDGGERGAVGAPVIVARLLLVQGEVVVVPQGRLASRNEGGNGDDEKRNANVHGLVPFWRRNAFL